MDNTKQEKTPFESEGGFSLWIENGGTKILYDMGMSEKIFVNARLLDIDLSTADYAVVSHGHFDHTGGLRRFLEENRSSPVYLHPAAWRRHLSNTTGTLRVIGMDDALLREYPERFIPVGNTMDAGDLSFIVPSEKRKRFVPSGNRVLFEEIGGAAIPDPFLHEIIFVMHGESGLIVFSGCSHQGIENVMDAVVSRFPDEPVRAFFGGFHLTNPAIGKLSESEETIKGIALRLLNYTVGCYYTGHCTGAGAYGIMKDVMGERIDLLSAGKIVEI